MENEDALVIEKCVIFVKAPDFASRVSSAIVDGKNKVPITLPRVKCLEDEPNKYFPYTGNEVINLKSNHFEEKIDSKELTIREKESHRLYGLGVSVKDIAKQFRTSSDHVRRLISTAKSKLGERPFYQDTVREGQSLSAKQQEVYDLNKQGLTHAQIAEKLKLKQKSITSMLRRAKIKLGERSVKRKDQ